MKLNIKPEHGDKLARDLYTATQLKANYPAWYDRWTKHLGRTELDFGLLSVFVNEWQNAGYSTSSHGPMNPLASVVDIEAPEGLYLANYICEYGYADYSFGGTFVYYPGNGSTNVGVWHEKWMGGTERDLFRHAMHGTNLEGSYSESFSFGNVRLLGRAATAVLADPSYKSTGLSVFDAGETSKVSRIYAEGFNNVGVKVLRGTPLSADEITVFNNCDAGIRFEGCAGNTGDVKVVSGDDNGVLIEFVAGNGRQAGGQFNFGAIKSEAGVTPISRNPHRKQKLMVLRGQFGVNVGVVRGSHSQVRVDDLIEVDCRLTDGTKQVSNLVVGSINGFNYGNVVKDVANGWAAADPGDFNCFSLQYSSANGGKLFNPFHTFAGAPNAGGGTVTPPPVNPPTTGTAKWSKTYTTATTTSTKVAVPSGVNPIQSTKLTNVKFSNLAVAYVNSGLFVGQDGYLWLSNGFVRAKDTAGNEIKVTAGVAMNVTVPMPNTTLTHTIGGAGSTAIFTGTVECF